MDLDNYRLDLKIWIFLPTLHCVMLVSCIDNFWWMTITFHIEDS